MLQRLHLQNFRNYSDVLVEIHPQTVYVLGDNAQGKTNLLESIYYLGRGKSFRTSAREDLIRNGEAEALIHAATEFDGLKDELAVQIGERRRFLRNGKAVRRPDVYWPHVILFAPEETLLFKLSPSDRRDYFDTLIEGVEPSYAKLRRDYGKVVQQRNRLLREADDYAPAQLDNMLSPWDEQLAQLGVRIGERRDFWTQRLNAELAHIHPQFAAADGTAQLVYEPNVALEADFAQVLAARRNDERMRRMSLVGPHRDEFRVELGGQDLRHQGSQGQHRSVVLSLKLAEIQLATLARGRAPLLLLDDVASELDPTRCSAFFHCLHEAHCQTIITTTHSAGTIPELKSDFASIQVESGFIQFL